MTHKLRKLCLILLSASWLFSPAACASKDSSSPTPASSGNGLKILALGDSYTMGESLPEAARWSKLLAAQMHEQGQPAQEPGIIARTGWTTANLRQALQRHRLAPPYDIVTLMTPPPGSAL